MFSAKNIVTFLFGGILFNASAQKITLEDFQKGTFRARPGVMYEFTPDGNDLLKMSSNEENNQTHWFITTVAATKNFQTGDTLFSSKWFKDSVPVGQYTLSENREYLLIETNHAAIYRHSFTVNAYVADLKNRTLKAIPGTLRYPSLSPDNTKLAYVKENNLFIYDLNKNWETQITQDGKINELINGAVDWVYEEEFSMSQGFQWSPSGRYIAFYKFDESKVKEFSMDAFNTLYPDQIKWKYPKAGEDNSRVDVFVYDTRAKNQTQIPLMSHQDQYIPRFQWMQNDQYLSIQRLNRWQNHWEVLMWNTQENKLHEIIEEGSDTYVDINEQFTLIPESTEFLYLSEISGFKHIYRCDYIKKKVESVTEGNWQVNEIHAYNPKTKTIFYTSTEASTVEDHLYSIQTNGKQKKSILQYKPLSGNQRVMSSKNGKWIYIINSCMTETPHLQTILIGDKFRHVQDDTALRNKLNETPHSKVEFHELAIPETPFSLNYYLIKPLDFDPSKKYPLLMYCYGGPGNSIARNSMNSYWSWYQYLASKGYIIACVDNRGTGNKGAEFKKCTYLNLGKLEQEDQRFAAEYFGKLPFVDKTRIGIWGWSFGGYLTSLCMVKSPDVFKMGMAIAPVTHWKYYDNIYTERYLRRPIDNPEGYEQNSPINFADQLTGKYLIVHGTGDDNVHFQNTAEMINALIKAGKNFDSEIYPNRAHGISDRSAQKHLFKKLSTFILENL